jgi:hypothetical protein
LAAQQQHQQQGIIAEVGLMINILVTGTETFVNVTATVSAGGSAKF